MYSTYAVFPCIYVCGMCELYTSAAMQGFLQLENIGSHQDSLMRIIGGHHETLEGHNVHHHRHHLSIYHDGRLGTTDDFATSSLNFSLFSAALCDLANSRPVHSLMLSSHLFLCLPCLLPPLPCLARGFWLDLMNGRHDHTTGVCVFLQSSGGFRLARVPAGSWHVLPRW